MSASISIPRQFNGPLESGNGGYCAGVFAALSEQPVAVNLRRPVPLEVGLQTVAAGAGEIHVKHGEELIAEVQPAPVPALAVPDPIDLGQAKVAARRYRARPTGCQPVFRLRQGPEWSRGEDGAVRLELVFSVLDCPTVFAAFLGSEEEPIAFLVRRRRGPGAGPGADDRAAWRLTG